MKLYAKFNKERMFHVSIVWYVTIYVRFVEVIRSAGPTVNCLWIITYINLIRFQSS